MTDDERQQILKMVEDGKITAEEGLKLMQALAQDTAIEESVTVETISGGEAASAAESDPEFDRKLDRFRRLWIIPLVAGILITVAGAYWMYTSLQSSGLGFWFYCAWLPFLLGVAVIALGFDSRTSRWIYVDVHQKPGDSPERIVVTFPLSPVTWLVSLVRNYIPAEQKGAADSILNAIFRSTKSSEPMFVDVHDDDGEHIQVYIG